MVSLIAAGGCLGGNEVREGEPWPEAARNTLTESELQLIRDAGLPPEEIESETDAIRVGLIVGWAHQLEELETSRLDPVESFLETAIETEQTLQEVETTLEQVDELIRTMKNRQIGPVSAWEIATGLFSSAQAFDEAVKTSLHEVRDWRTLISSVTETLEDSLRLIRNQLQAQTLQGDQLDQLATNIAKALENLDELESRSNNLQEDLSSFAEISETIANNSGEFRSNEVDLTDEVETVYGTANDVFTEAASELQAFNEELRNARSVLEELESGASDIQQDTLNEMRGRHSIG
ncbi:hypothetical protein [Halonotius sp. GCM10025705]|uniref:hypothetical protein n=1 Tax=Halonotius sp. GCM10025705 TaxID=3252678 RepID=UPI00361218AC